MITRIVKMTFLPEKVADFVNLFERYQHRIASAEGCLSVKLLRHKSQAHIYFTLSIWQSEDFLNQYRLSPLFAEVWPQTKEWFQAAAEAWSLEDAEIPLNG
jgi:heme-degrading monooxygenase HmoA